GGARMGELLAERTMGMPDRATCAIGDKSGNEVAMSGIEREECDGIVLIRLSGEVDLSWSQQVRHAVLEALEKNPAVGVELSQVSYIDSSGIAALVEGFQNARSRGSRFALVAVSDAVRAGLQLRG